MRTPQKLFICLCLLICFSSCSKDEMESFVPVIGEWRLTSRTIGENVDGNNDDSFSLNFLDEISCRANEVLIFEKDGSVISSNTFNSNIDFFKDVTNQYRLISECNDEGVVSWAAGFTQNMSGVEINGRTYLVNKDEMICVFQNEISIFNTDFTEVIETRDLTLIYTRQ